MKTPREIAEILGGAKKEGTGYKCRCPCHEDKHGSLHISQAEDGGFLAHCWAGCDDKLVWQTVRDRCGLNGERRSEAQPAYFAPRYPDPVDLKLSGSLPSDFWAYESESGTLLLIVARYDADGRKTIRPWTWNGAKWLPKAAATPRPLFGLRMLAKAPASTVLLVEGEKTATAARLLFPSLVSMTWPGGAESVVHANWEPLRGRDVILWPDNDAPGRGAMQTAEGILLALGCRVRHVGCDEALPVGWDVADARWDVPQAADYLRSHIGPWVAPADPLPFVWATDIAEDVRFAEEIVEDLLTLGGMSVWYGESNSGKTYLALDAACAVARGADYLGKRTKRGLVIYVAGEGAGTIEHRLLAYKRKHGLDRLDVGIVKTGLDLRSSAEDSEKLVALITSKARQMGGEVVLVIFDTLARMISGGNENSPEDMGALVANSDLVRQKTGAHVCWIHHTGKDLAKGARGHSSLRAATDTEIEVVHDQATGARVIKVTKQRDLSTGGMELAGKLLPIELGINGWGKPVSACVVESADVPEKESKDRSGRVQKLILHILKAAGGKMPKKDLRDALADAGIGKSSQYFAIDALEKQGLIDYGLSHCSLVQSVQNDKI